MKITLIRHTSVDVAAGICYGQSDVQVAASFELEAAFVKSKLASFHFEAAYSSPLQRCSKLAHYCGFDHPLIDNRLMELNFGDWELQAWDKITDPQLQQWYNNWTDETPTNGESFKTLIQRTELFLENVMDLNHNHMAVFTHAGIIRAVAIILGKITIDNAFELQVDYGQVFTFDL